MVTLDAEIRHLVSLMPASGRMWVKLVSRPQQRSVLTAQFPRPWQRSRPIYINFDLWARLPRPQRDLLLLRQVCWLTGVKWFEPNPYQAALAVGAVVSLVQLSQGDALGAMVATGLAGLAGAQVWRINRSETRELTVDREALKVAERRGYDRPTAARHLLEGLESLARLERRDELTFAELLRAQALRAIADLSPLRSPI